MRKIILIVTTLLLSVAFVGCEGSDKETLYILNWGEYIDQDLVSKFEKEFDVKVVYEEVDSNEMMYTKISSGGTAYDLAFPSEYMIEKMKNEDMLLPIDKDIVENLSSVDEKYYELTEFDTKGDYYVPYFTGSIGIMYNTELVSEKDLTGWDVLWNDKFNNKVYMYDSIREAMAVGALYNGYSLNTSDEAELEDIRESLRELNPKLRGYGTDDLKNLVASGDGAMAVVYSGDYLVTYMDQMDTTGELNVGYFAPETGTNVWLDGMVIPNSSKNSELANKFINFMLETENATQNAEWVGYTTTNAKVFDKFVNSGDKLYTTDAYVLPEKVLENSEVYKDLGAELTQKYSEIFVKVKNK